MWTDRQRFRFLGEQLGPLTQPRLVLLTGARQTGKTTLARERYPDLRYVNLDAPALAAARFLELAVALPGLGIFWGPVTRG